MFLGPNFKKNYYYVLYFDLNVYYFGKEDSGFISKILFLHCTVYTKSIAHSTKSTDESGQLF